MKMKKPDDFTGELSRLFWAIRDGRCSAADIERLETLAREDAEVRASYIQFTVMCGLLRYMRASPDSSATMEALSISPIAPVKDGGPFSVAWHHTREYLSSGWPMAYLAATLIVGVGITIAAFTYISSPERTVIQSHSGSLSVAISSKPQCVGRITGMVDCRWDDSDRGVQEAEEHGQQNLSTLVSLGDRFNIRSGLLEITYNTGARVVLQGPVTYDVDSAAGGYLAVGKLTARLENKKESETKKKGKPDPSFSSAVPNALFAVRTPSAVVTDLGTEFGVEVTRDGITEAHVFVGVISVTPFCSNRATGISQILGAGSAIRLDGKMNQLARIVSKEKHFVRYTAIPRSKATDPYAEMVLSMHPVVYYRMERATGEKDQLFDSSPGAHHGVFRCDRAFWCASRAAGPHGEAFLLRGPIIQDHGFVADYPKSSDGHLSVSAWVWSASTNEEFWPAIAANWGHAVNGQFHLGLAGTEQDLECCVADRTGKMVIVREGAPLPRQTWQHVAFTCDGKQVRLYRNGSQVAMNSCDGLLLKTPIQCLTVGCNATDAGDGGDTHHFWQGRIDDLAVFNQTLLKQDVRRLYEGPATSSAARPINNHDPKGDSESVPNRNR